jgi:hypothetical protein
VRSTPLSNPGSRQKSRDLLAMAEAITVRNRLVHDNNLHDFVGPRNGVQNGRVEVTGRSIGLFAVNHLLGIDQGASLSTALGLMIRE